MLVVGASIALIVMDQGLRHLAITRGWPLAMGNHLIHLPGQELAVLLLGLIIFFLGNKRRLYSLATLTAGAISNLLSGLLPHGIIDYIPFGLFYTNGADLLITSGAIWYVITLLRQQPQ